MTLFKDSQEKQAYFQKMNEVNSLRVMPAAIFLFCFMAFEIAHDIIGFIQKKMSTDFVCGFKIFGRYENYYLVFISVEVTIILLSILILIVRGIYKKNPDKNQKIFFRLFQFYGTAILFLSVSIVIVDSSTFYELDLNFFYLISIICAAIFYMDPILFISEVLLSNAFIWILVTELGWGKSFSPYTPYCTFILIILCLCSISRCWKLLKDLRKEEEIKELQKEAEKENQLKSMFLANMSHEIRTPMNAIVGMSELALDYDLNEAEKNNLRQIHSSGLALVSIINDILDFSKIESGKMEIVPVKYDLLKMIYDSANVAKVKLAGKDVELRIELEENLFAFYNGDDLRLRQILINLVGNAAKFTEEGYVIIRVENLNKYDETKNGLRFSVIDSGCGIKDEDKAKLFTAFQQVDMKMNRTKGGTGLGLSISKRLVQLMGGSMGVSSVYGKGSCFYFDVPQKNETDEKWSQAYAPIFKEAEQNIYHNELKNLPLERLLNKNEFAALFAEKNKKSGFVCHNAKILVVDDNEVNLQVACGLLKKFGVVAETAPSGFEAIKKLKASDYHLVFMDHQMPVMDGIETMEKIRQSETTENKHTIIVALSANAVNGAKQMFLSKGFDDFVSKPVQGKDFGECLKKWLPSEIVEEIKEDNSNQNENKAAQTQENTEPEEKIPGINLENAFNLTGGKENWLKLVQTFCGLVENKAALMEKLLNEKDFKNYSIEVHALKSSSKVIGAEELSDKAKELEFLSKTATDYSGKPDSTTNENLTKLIAEIEEKSAVLIELYKKIKTNLENSLKNEAAPEKSKPQTDIQQISQSDLDQLLTDIKNAAENNDLSAAEETIEKLKSYSLPENLKNLPSELDDAIQNIDFDKVQEILSDK